MEILKTWKQLEYKLKFVNRMEQTQEEQCGEG